MADRDMALMAHLMRRAGFGAPREELEARVAKGYEATVEDLLDPDAHGIPPLDELLMARFHPDIEFPTNPPSLGASNFMYHLIHTQRPLEEKITLFWHMVFATGASKLAAPKEITRQLAMFRKCGLGNYRELLVELAKDPAMIYWLDNNVNHKKAPNENWGRELLELFSMGQGNYTEKDVFECSRAFTGWALKPRIPRQPYGGHLWQFEYKEEDHDDGEKVFLDQRGRFNGEDIIDIIVQQPATARFIARHLYNFFVADEVQVPSWKDIPPRDPEAVQAITDAFVSSGYDIRSTLRMLFNSEFFKDEKVWFARVKSPAEVVAGTIRLVGEDFREPRPGLMEIAQEPEYQGQELINPPSVEGWHTGQEWIDSGALLQRVNFVADKLGDTSLPGVRAVIDRLSTRERMSAEEFVEGCLELIGPLRVGEETRQELVEHAKGEDEIRRGATEEERSVFVQQVTQMLQLISATREYQFC